jgi:hypothetical protein
LSGDVGSHQSDGFRIEQSVVEIDIQHSNPVGNRSEEILLPNMAAIDEEFGDRNTGVRLLLQETFQNVFGEQPTIDEELPEPA